MMVKISDVSHEGLVYCIKQKQINRDLNDFGLILYL